jgi:serine/threonine protein kinase
LLQSALARMEGQPVVFTTEFDMWQLGTVVYEISGGKPYWPAPMSDLQILHTLASPSVKLPHEARPVETELLQRILSQLLTRLPTHRLTADSLRKLLEKEEATGPLALTINAGYARTDAPIVLDP